MNLNEKLIEMVQPHPCLYDCRHKDFKNMAKKDLLWERIAKDLNENCEVIKAKWKNLKDGYTKYKKSTIPSTSGKKKAYLNWVWGPTLSFLDSAIQSRTKACNCNSEVLATETELQSRSPSPNDASVTASPPPIEVISVEETLPLSNLQRSSTPSQSSRKRGPVSQEDSFDKVWRHLCNLEKKDSIDLFFESYAKTLKKMKPRTQTTIKLQIAQIFAEAEIAEESEDSNMNETYKATR